MPDRITELQHLALAERHIEEGTARIDSIRRCIGRLRALGGDCTPGANVLSTMQEVMKTLEAHRSEIVTTLQQMDRQPGLARRKRSAAIDGQGQPHPLAVP